MYVLSRAMLLILVSTAAAFCQTAPSQDTRRFFVAYSDFEVMHSPRPIGALSVNTGIPAVPVTSDNADLALLTRLRFTCCIGRQATSATYRTLTPFSYTIAKDRFDYFPVKVGPLRYTFWSRTSQFNRPAGGRLQNLVDGVLRHYTSDPVIPLNKKCVRSLACNSLYEQAVRRRAVPSTTR